MWQDNMFGRKKKKVNIDKRYVIAADNGNYLSFICFRQGNVKPLHQDTLWVVDIAKAIQFDSLKVASTLMSYLGQCHLEERGE